MVSRWGVILYSVVLMTPLWTKYAYSDFKQINNPEYHKFETVCITMMKKISSHDDDVIFKSLKNNQNLLVHLLIQKHLIWTSF